MDPFEMPDTLPADAEALAALRAHAADRFAALKAIVADGGDLDDDQLAELRAVVDALPVIDAATDELAVAEQARRDETAALIDAVEAEADADEVEVEVEGAEVTDETEDSLAASGKTKAVAKTKFAPSKTPAVVEAMDAPQVGFAMEPGSPGYKPGLVGFDVLAEAIDSVRPGSRASKSFGQRPDVRPEYSAQTLARLDRGVELVEDSHALVAAITAATDESKLPGGSLVAAGGWCAPSETLYDFCAVPSATDLISLPEITIRRGGVRWPIEPDLSAIFESFQFYFTETELEAVDGEGNPTAVKNCVSIPCPDDFEELRLNAVGYCVEAGILQAQGWPELIEWFLQNLVAEHLRAISRRTILDMVAGSEAKTIPAGSQIAAGSSVLNSLSLMAVNLRIKAGLGRTATIEGVAPVWLHDVIRADLANQQGTETKNVTDAQIDGWLSARNIALQFVGDWQTRTAGMPGHLDTVEYPDEVKVLLYPAGTWFRAMSNVIELGTMYPKEQLQVNRYTLFFTEDAIAVGKRCNDSLVVTVPICPSGAYGPQQAIDCVPAEAPEVVPGG